MTETNMSSGPSDSLETSLRRAAKSLRRGRRTRVTAMLIAIGGALGWIYLRSLIGVAAFAAGNGDPLLNTLDRAPSAANLLIGECVVVAVGLPILLTAGSRRLRRASSEIVRVESLSAIGPLSEVLWTAGKQHRRLAAESLKQLLPQLTSSRYGLLDDEQHDCLNRALLGRDVALARAVLRAWEQVGDTRDEAALISLSRGDGPARLDPALETEARQCLQHIYLKEEKRNMGQSLLRPAGPGIDSDALLRPATAAFTDSELLRPA